MRGKLYSPEEKERVKHLIIEGKSYREIRELMGVPKSTISVWFGKTVHKPYDTNALLKHLANIRPQAAIALKRKYEKIRSDEMKTIRTNLEEELKSYPFGNLGFYKSLLAMLYWAEGSRHSQISGTKFANIDPSLSLLYVTLLRKCYRVNENKLKIGLYVHYYHSIKKVKRFWSETLNVPLERFHKVYIKKRSKTKKYRKNFAGVCFIYYGDSKVRKELLELGTILQKTITNMRP